MAPLGFSARLQRQSNSSAAGNQNVRVGGYHRGLNSLTRLNTNTGARVASGNVGRRSVPRPIQTSSLKKENGGQDITAVLVNRNQASGKKVGWGSALPSDTASVPNPSAPTPAETTVSTGKPEFQNNPSRKQNSNVPRSQNSPPLPPPPTDANRNVPWALHPPANLGTSPASKSSQAPPEGPPLKGGEDPHFRHQPIEQGNENMHQKHSHQHGSYHSRDYQYRRESYTHSNGQHPSERFERSDRFPPHNQHPDMKRYQNNYRDRNEMHDRPYSRGFEMRADFRERDQRYGGYENRYDYRGRDFRDSRGWYERDRGPTHAHEYRNNTSYSNRSQSPNYYSRSRPQKIEEERRRGENSSSFSQRNSYGTENSDAMRHDAHNEPGDTEENSIERRRNYDSRGLKLDGMGDSQQKLQSYSQNGTFGERARLTNPAQSDFHNRTSEGEIALQSVRAREAAERARKEKEVASQDNAVVAPQDHNIASARSFSNEPISILRNKQPVSGVSNDMASDRESPKVDHQSEDVLVEGSDCNACFEKGTKADKQPETNVSVNDATEVVENSEQNVKEQQSITMDLELDDKRDQVPLHSDVKVNTEETASKSKKLRDVEVQTSSHEEEHPHHDRFIPEKQKQSKALESLPEHEMEDASSADVSEVVTVTSKDEKEGVQHNKQEQALEQQQNILRQVAAVRRNNKNGKPSSRRSDSKSRVDHKVKVKESKSQVPPEDESQTIVHHKIDIEDTIDDRDKLEAAAKEVRKEDRRTRGPRTKGVLFRRLPCGTLVNADLSEGEIAKREKRKKAKLEKIKAKEERMKAKEERIRKAKEERIKAKEERMNAEKKTTKKSPDKTTPKTPPARIQPKIFVPAPPPPVSAWKAGPPPGIINPTSSAGTHLNALISNPTSLPKSGGRKSVPSNAVTFPKTKLKNVKEDASNNSVDDPVSTSSSESRISIQFGDLKKQDARWTPSPHTKSDESLQKNQSPNVGKFTSMNPIALPMAGVVPWNAFGTPHLFAPPQQENVPMSADWSIRQDSNRDNAGNKAMQWSDGHAAPVIHSTIEDDAVEITDASAAVPHDLLSSAPGSEDDNNVSKANEQDESKEVASKRNSHTKKGSKNFDKRGSRNRSKASYNSAGKRKKRYPPKVEKKAAEVESTGNAEKPKSRSDILEARVKRYSRKGRIRTKKSGTDDVEAPRTKKPSFKKKNLGKGQLQDNAAHADGQNEGKRPKRFSDRSKTSRKPRNPNTSSTEKSRTPSSTAKEKSRNPNTASIEKSRLPKTSKTSTITE